MNLVVYVSYVLCFLQEYVCANSYKLCIELYYESCLYEPPKAKKFLSWYSALTYISRVWNAAPPRWYTDFQRLRVRVITHTIFSCWNGTVIVNFALIDDLRLIGRNYDPLFNRTRRHWCDIIVLVLEVRENMLLDEVIKIQSLQNTSAPTIPQNTGAPTIP